MPRRRGYYGDVDTDLLMEMGGPYYNPYSERPDVGYALRQAITGMVAKKREEEEAAKKEQQQEFENMIKMMQAESRQASPSPESEKWNWALENLPREQLAEIAGVSPEKAQKLKPSGYGKAFMDEFYKYSGMDELELKSLPVEDQGEMIAGFRPIYNELYGAKRKEELGLIQQKPTEYDKRVAKARELHGAGKLSDEQLQAVELGVGISAPENKQIIRDQRFVEDGIKRFQRLQGNLIKSFEDTGDKDLKFKIKNMEIAIKYLEGINSGIVAGEPLGAVTRNKVAAIKVSADKIANGLLLPILKGREVGGITTVPELTTETTTQLPTGDEALVQAAIKAMGISREKAIEYLRKYRGK